MPLLHQNWVISGINFVPFCLANKWIASNSFFWLELKDLKQLDLQAFTHNTIVQFLNCPMCWSVHFLSNGTVSHLDLNKYLQSTSKRFNTWANCWIKQHLLIDQMFLCRQHVIYHSKHSSFVSAFPTKSVLLIFSAYLRWKNLWRQIGKSWVTSSLSFFEQP